MQAIDRLNVAKSIEAFQKLFVLSRVLGDPEGERTALMRLSCCHFMNGQFDDSIHFSDKLIDIYSSAQGVNGSDKLMVQGLNYNIMLAKI